ncbi:MAG: SpoIID/LytB domain-containing protein [Oscillospiraceae bacterium]|nr:SpoIID/LytB domain-containing protein [Oscillospiraceae bacterium]
MNRTRAKNFICFFCVLIFLLPIMAQAYAAGPEDEPEKGLIPASSTELNEASYADGSLYEPVPVDVDLLYIGLSFDQNAVYEADFRNAEGKGFRIGTLDGDRCFHAFAESANPVLMVRPERNIYVMLDELFSTREEAAQRAQRYLGKVVSLDGSYRVIIGPLRDSGEVAYTIGWFALSAEVWQEDCLAVYDGTGRLIDLYVGAEELAVEPVSDGKARTEYGGELYYGSFLLRRWEGGRLTVINAVELEDYVKGVIPYEMSSSWPMEALKAQAVCARTYAVRHVGDYEEDYGFDLTNDTESQVYRGINGADAVTDAAVDATEGLFVRYRGEICEVYYFSSDGGATEDGANIFGNDQPYLAGKTDPFERAKEDAVIKWKRWRSGAEIAERLRQKGFEIGKIVAIEAEYTELGNVAAMRYTDADSVCVRLEGRDGYSFLALDSACFRIEPDEYGFTFTGRGWGHNCGMSQWGAHAMASVYGYTADEIIRFYFTGAYTG